MKRTGGLLLVTTVAMLAGCGGTQEPGAAPSSPVTADVEAIPTPTPTPTPTPSASGETSQRGNIIKEIGETAWASEDPSGADPWLEFQITDIAVGGECTSDIAEPAENGQFLILSISASTGTTWPADLQA